MRLQSNAEMRCGILLVYEGIAEAWKSYFRWLGVDSMSMLRDIWFIRVQQGNL